MSMYVITENISTSHHGKYAQYQHIIANLYKFIASMKYLLIHYISDDIYQRCIITDDKYLCTISHECTILMNYIIDIYIST